MKTKIEKIKEATETCLKKMKVAIESKDSVTIFMAMYEVSGILIASEIFEFPEITKMVNIDPITEEFIKICKEEAERK